MKVEFIDADEEYITVRVNGSVRSFLLHGHDESLMKTFFISGECETLMYFDTFDQSIGTI